MDTQIAIYSIQMGFISAIIVGLIGVGSVLITVFFAEPRRIAVQNQDKLVSLKKALYKELIHDFLYLHELGSETIDDYSRVMPLALESGIRLECFKHATANEIGIYYQLDEAILINRLYGMLSLAANLRVEKLNELDAPLTRPQVATLLRQVVSNFLTAIGDSYSNGRLDRELMNQVLTVHKGKQSRFPIEPELKHNDR